MVSEEQITPQEAANRIGVSWMNAAAVRERVAEIIQEWALPPEADRELVRSSRRQVLLEALQKGNMDMAIKAGNAMAGDPEVGLTQPPQTAVQINIEAVKPLIDKLNALEAKEVPLILVDERNSNEE